MDWPSKLKEFAATNVDPRWLKPILLTECSPLKKWGVPVKGGHPQIHPPGEFVSPGFPPTGSSRQKSGSSQVLPPQSSPRQSTLGTGSTMSLGLFGSPESNRTFRDHLRRLRSQPSPEPVAWFLGSPGPGITDMSKTSSKL